MVMAVRKRLEPLAQHYDTPEHRSPREIYRESSDSSMDDCNVNPVKKFNTSARSDSSMDDCNGQRQRNSGRPPAFRFLYGRL